MCLNIPTWTQARVSSASTPARKINSVPTPTSIKVIQYLPSTMSFSGKYYQPAKYLVLLTLQ